MGLTRESCRSCLVQNVLLLATVAGVVIGIILGVGLRALPEDQQLDSLDIVYLKEIGKNFKIGFFRDLELF